MATKGIIGRKVGMTQIFDQESGRLTPVTVIQAGPCPVVAVRTADADGYDAVQLAFDEVAEGKLTKPALGHLKKAGVAPHRRLVEIRGVQGLAAGDTVTVEAFEPGDRVKVTGTSIGKGFQGTVKRHNFARGPVTHGSHNVRAPGSIGASATPSRVFKGLRMAGQMGAGRVTQLGLTVVDRDPELNVILVKGAVPGHKNAVVVIREDDR
jgi:large subunit ribosomal protein L3